MMNEIPIVRSNSPRANGIPGSYAVQYFGLPEPRSHGMEAEYIDPDTTAKVIPEMQRIARENEYMHANHGMSPKYPTSALNTDNRSFARYIGPGMVNGLHPEPSSFDGGPHEIRENSQHPVFFECRRASLGAISPELSRRLGSLPIGGFMVMDDGHSEDLILGVPMAVFLKEAEKGTLVAFTERLRGELRKDHLFNMKGTMKQPFSLIKVKAENYGEGSLPGAKFLPNTTDFRETQRSVFCSKCDLPLKSLSDLQCHMEEHHSNLKDYACHVCSVNFGDLDLLLQHVKIHYIQRKFKCHLCGKGFGLRCQWRFHLNMHGKRIGISCRSCHKAFNFEREYNRHTLNCHQAFLQCETCSYESSLFADFREHVKKHIDEKARCGVCRKDFPTVRDLDRHRTSHAKSESLICGHCDVFFSNKKKLLLHRRLYRLHGKKRYLCVECGAKFAGIRALKQHKLSQHSILEKVSYQCQECFISFGSRIALSKHSRKVHSKDPKQRDQQLLTLSCDLCSFTSTSKWKFEEHFSFFHPSIFPYKCNSCTLRLRSLDEFRDHSEIHSRSFLHQTFPCSHCYNVFFAESALQRHLENEQVKTSKEEEERLFRSDMASGGKSINDESNLNTDQPSLSSADKQGQAAFDCDFCSKRLSSAYLIKEHFIADHYSLPPYKCCKCQKRFVAPLLKRRHEANVHKIAISPADLISNLHEGKEGPVGGPRSYVGQNQNQICDDSLFSGDGRLLENFQSDSRNQKPPKRKAAQHRSFSQYSFANLGLEYEQNAFSEAFDGMEDPRKRSDVKPRAYTVVHCDLCNEVLVTAMKAKEHFVKFHSGMGPYKCDICDQRFQSLYIRKNHMLKHQDDTAEVRKRFPCERCGKTFLKGYSLREHLLRHSQNDEKFAETGQRVSISPKRQELVCDLCGTMLVTALKAKEHFIEHHDGMAPYKCFICDKRLWSMHTRKEHMALHEDFSMLRNTYTCEKCNKTFAKKASLQEHLLRHTKAETAEFTRNDLGQYPCKLCTDVFLTLEEVTTHFNDCHDKLGCHEDKTFRRLQVMMCDLCGEKLVTGIKAKSHFVEKHNGLPPYCCSKCDKRFHSAYARNKHLLSHEENFHELRPKFPCNKCDKVFCSKFTLKKHMAVHYSENEGGDELSGRHLSESQSVDEEGEVVYEVRVEEEDSIEIVEPLDSDLEPKPKNRRKGIYSSQQGDLDFSCVYCGLSFRYSHHLVTHMIKQHPEEEMNTDEEGNRNYCELCGDLLMETRLAEHFFTKHSGVSASFCFICDKPLQGENERQIHVTMHQPSGDTE